MSSTIKTGELSSKPIEIKTRRSVTKHVSDIKNESITVFYNLETYYVEGEEEVVTSVERKFYSADFDSWKNSDHGQAIEAALLSELNKEVPGE